MSLISHQSAVNRTTNFWGNEIAGVGGNPPYPIAQQDTYFFDEIPLVSGRYYFLVDSTIIIPELPYDMTYNFNFSFDSKYVSDDDNAQFELTAYTQGGSQDTTVKGCVNSLLGYTNTSIIKQFLVPANTPSRNLFVYLNLLTPGSTTLTAYLSYYVIGVPASIPS
jgi:hypothetical protein